LRPRARSPRARRVPGRGRGHHRSRHGRRRRAAGACRSRRRDHPARARPPRRLRADRRARRLQPGAGRWRGAEKPRGASPLGRRPPGPRGARRHRGRRDPPPGALPRRRPGGRGAHRVDRLGPRHAGGRWRRGGARALAARGPTLPRHARRARRPRRRPHPRLVPPASIRTTVAIALALAASAPAAEEATVALNFQDVELPVLARFVSEVTGRNFIIDDRVRGKVTIISPTRITPDEAYLVFQSVLQVKGFTTVPSGAFTK